MARNDNNTSKPDDNSSVSVVIPVATSFSTETIRCRSNSLGTGLVAGGDLACQACFDGLVWMLLANKFFCEK